MEIRRVGLADPLVVPLLTGLAEEYLHRYGPNDVLADAAPAEFEPPDGAFVVLLDGGTTVAGGGIRRHDADTCEVKRMWTAATHRRQGLAMRVLDALEVAGRELGYARLVLETGPAQPEAAALYRGRGYRDLPHYGAYDQALAFERPLA